MLKLLGARLGEYPEGLVIQGGGPLGGTALDSLGDAPMAMAWGIAGALAHGESLVQSTYDKMMAAGEVQLLEEEGEQ